MQIQDWNGFRMESDTIDGRETFLVFPETPAAGKPWVWRAEYFGAFAQVDIALLKNGWHVAYCGRSDQYASEVSMKEMKQYHDALVKEYGLSTKADIFGFSRGGLYTINYAHAFPEDVSTIYLDAPFIDIRFWKHKQSPSWDKIKEEYGITDETVETYEGNPINRAYELPKKKIPAVIITGDADEAVDYTKHAEPLAAAYKAAGTDILYVVKPGAGHHPHSLEDPTKIVGFIMNHRV